MNTLDQIETALNAMHAYFQTVHRDFEALQDTGNTHDRRLSELAATLETVQQELQTARQTTTDLEVGLNAQRVAMREQAEVQARELTVLSDRFQEQTQAQERVAALENRLSTQVAQFGKIETVLRELHGELVTLHQRMTALETTGSPAPAKSNTVRIGVLIAIIIVIAALVLFKFNAP